ncbi:hypothetical protein VTJ49DRAFT_2270 [Mycothermus thermophilus]|uniref:Uncharacterized protein n=1 Tax=Humicola insolens TaxID=85995 RepID=A0ABR3VA62_HUMIN
MSSPLPVPSKAALTALRGLVVGTSCTLALVAEDRRRRIKQAMRAVQNGEKIKSNRKYRAGGGAALAVALEEETVVAGGGGGGGGWDPALGVGVPVMGGLALRPRGEGGGTIDTSKTNTVVASADDTNNTVNHSPPPSEPNHTTPLTKKSAVPPIVRPLPRLSMPSKATPSWLQNETETIKAYTFPTTAKIVAKAHDACDTKDPRKLGSAVQTVLEAMDHRVAPGNLDRPWIEATARLCRTCRQEGRLDDAVTLLYRVLTQGPLEESAYLDHEPLALIEELLAQAENLGQQDRNGYTACLEKAISLFFFKFVERPTEANPQVCSLGRRLLELSFSAGLLGKVFGIFRRSHVVAGADAADLTGWFIGKLYEVHDYKSAVRVFVTTYAQSSPTEESLQTLGDRIVESVELAHNYRPDDVLKTMLSVCKLPGNTSKLSPKWVIRLLLSHWKRCNRFDEIEMLFEQLHTPTLRDSVYRHENIYRVMVELALEAGDKAKAEFYFRLAVSQDFAFLLDVRLLGLFARFDAAAGDWEAVHGMFEAMNRSGRPTAEAYGKVFIPILKAYAETHTVRETEVFLKSYVKEFEIPLCSYTVTLMAKKYAAIRDVHSLIAWLEYCSCAGFPIDAAFTNSILVRCRRQWNFSFRDLRTLFRKLRALSPDFVDEHTEQVMADAALSDSKYGGKAAKGRLLSLRLELSTLPTKCKLAQPEDVALAMKEALALNRPRRALWIYKRALHLQVPFSQHALRLAVHAHLATAPDDFSGAFGLVRAAQTKGEDVMPAINYLLARQLGTLTAPAADDPAETDALIQSTLTEYHRAGILLTQESLHRAAIACLEAKQFGGAIRYAHLAAHAPIGSTNNPPSSPSSVYSGPCFNLQNFRILLFAYASLVDVDGLRDTVARGLAHPYREKAGCRSALRNARKWITYSQARASTSLEERRRARAVVDEGIAMVVEARKRLRAEGRKLEEAALRIMRAAARDSGRGEVDFGVVPWLGGKGVAVMGGQMGGEEEEEEEEEEAEVGEEMGEIDEVLGMLGCYPEKGQALVEGSGRSVVEAF